VRRDRHYQEKWNWTNADPFAWSKRSQLNNNHGKFGRVSGHIVALSTIFSQYLILRLLLFWSEHARNARSIIPSARSCLRAYIGFLP
jgi:hypothetical protein